jgi:predicted nucleic acid-binding protein
VSFLVDTNVISAARRGPRRDPRVARWWESVDDESLFTSAIVVGEIRRGIELVRRRGDESFAHVLESWLEEFKQHFGDRILSVNVATAEEWGRMNAVRTTKFLTACSPRPQRFTD